MPQFLSLSPLFSRIPARFLSVPGYFRTFCAYFHLFTSVSVFCFDVSVIPFIRPFLCFPSVFCLSLYSVLFPFSFLYWDLTVVSLDLLLIRLHSCFSHNHIPCCFLYIIVLLSYDIYYSFVRVSPVFQPKNRQPARTSLDQVRLKTTVFMTYNT